MSPRLHVTYRKTSGFHCRPWMIIFLFAESHSHFICTPTYTSLLSLHHCYFSGWESVSPAAWKSRYCQEASLNINEFIKYEGSLKHYHNPNVPNKNFLSLNQHILQLSAWLSFPVIASDEPCVIWDICTKYTQNNLSGKSSFTLPPIFPSISNINPVQIVWAFIPQRKVPSHFLKFLLKFLLAHILKTDQANSKFRV